MKAIELRKSNGVRLDRTFTASLRGGGRGFPGAMAMEPMSNRFFPTVRTITGFVVAGIVKET